MCLTYDDGLDCHLDVVVPQLDDYGLKGTFFVTGSSPSLYNRMDEWRQIAMNGHELGNHTLFHPCAAEGRDFITPEFDLSTYSLDRLFTELRTANTLLKAIDGREDRTFAYTCTDVLAANGYNFSDTISTIFGAARGGDSRIPDSMNGYDVFNAPSWATEDASSGELIDFVKEAGDKGTIAIFMFHSVGGGYLNTGAEEHRQLLKYLNEHSDEYYCATFREVMKYIRKE